LIAVIEILEQSGFEKPITCQLAGTASTVHCATGGRGRDIHQVSEEQLEEPK